MLKDEFEKLLALFEKGAQGKKVNMDEVLEQSLQFFEDLQKEFQTASPEDREAIMAMMNKMYEKIQSESQRIAEKTGLSEEQLIAYSDNPKNFTADQWFKIQETKKKMMKTGRTIHKILQPKEEKAPAPKKTASKIKKKNWIRS